MFLLNLGFLVRFFFNAERTALIMTWHLYRLFLPVRNTGRIPFHKTSSKHSRVTSRKFPGAIWRGFSSWKSKNRTCYYLGVFLWPRGLDPKSKSKQNTDMSTRWPYRPQQHGSCANHNDSEKTMATRSYSKCNFTTLKSRFLQNKFKKILPHCYWMLLLEWPSFIYIRNLPKRKRSEKHSTSIILLSIN